MATCSVTYSFVNGTNADATRVNTNFNNIVSFINTNALQADGSKTATFLNITNSPTTASSAVRRGYIDTLFPMSTTYTGLRAYRLAADTTALAALSPIAEGDLAYVLSDNLVRYYDGTVWKILTPQRGAVAVTVVTGPPSSGSAAVTFPVAFSTTPIVTASIVTNTLPNIKGLNISSLTTSGFTANVVSTLDAYNGTGAVTVHWTAYEATV